MKLDFITCSGANETTSIPQLLSLLEEFPVAEIGVQVSEEKALKGMRRYTWIKNLYDATMSAGLYINAALHVNRQWVEALCRGEIPQELSEFLDLSYEEGMPFFQRVQLNFKVGREETPDTDKLEEVIRSYPKQRFILSYNESNREIVRELFLRGVKFDCLFDSSFGAGVLPETRQEPPFVGIRQGYAGGITPGNVGEELSKIAKALERSSNAAGVYIDAQKGLEDVNGNMDLARMLAYLINVFSWQKSSSLRK